VDLLASLPSLHTLYINLVTEDEVDYVLKTLPGLQTLNGLGVDRDELADDFDTYQTFEEEEKALSLI
jgi:hypothetical protein